MGPINHRVRMPTYYGSNHPRDGIPSAHNHRVEIPTYYESNHHRDGILLAHNYNILKSKTKNFIFNLIINKTDY